VLQLSSPEATRRDAYGVISEEGVMIFALFTIPFTSEQMTNLKWSSPSYARAPRMISALILVPEPGRYRRRQFLYWPPFSQPGIGSPLQGRQDLGVSEHGHQYQSYCHLAASLKPKWSSLYRDGSTDVAMGLLFKYQGRHLDLGDLTCRTLGHRTWILLETCPR
jgi:hypothetical protein